jgi:hypothetical protein
VSKNGIGMAHRITGVLTSHFNERVVCLCSTVRGSACQFLFDQTIAAPAADIGCAPQDNFRITPGQTAIFQ